MLNLTVAVIPTMSVQEHAGNDKSCVWHATDFADGELKEEMFCIRFASVESEFLFLFLLLLLVYFIDLSTFSLTCFLLLRLLVMLTTYAC